MNKKDLLGMKYFLALSAIVISIYTYSMVTGWRFLSYGESNKVKNSTHTRGHYYRGSSYHHK